MIADLEMWNFHGGVMVVPTEAGQLHVAGSVVTTREHQRVADPRSYQCLAASSRYIRLGAVLGVTLALALTGCTGGGSQSSGTEPTTPAVSAPQQDARGSAEELALAAYRGMWSAYAKAGSTANADEPDLARYASGDALKTLTSGLSAYRSKGQVLMGEYVSNPQTSGASPSSSPTAVTIEDCLDDTNFLVYDASGKPANDEPGGQRATRATVSNLGTEGWKVTSFGVQEVGTC